MNKICVQTCNLAILVSSPRPLSTVTAWDRKWIYLWPIYITSQLDSLPSLSPKLPTCLKWSYSPGWWWPGCPPTQWWWGKGLPSYLVRQWRLATKHKTDSLWLRRGRTQPGPVLLQEKSIQTNIPLSAFCPKVKIAFKAIPKLSWHTQPLGKSQNIPCTPITTLCQCRFSGNHLLVSLFEEGSF